MRRQGLKSTYLLFRTKLTKDTQTFGYHKPLLLHRCCYKPFLNHTVMEWYERMKTKIEVGKKYKNREGVVMTVVEEHPIESNYRERFWVVDETKNRYYYTEYTDGYAVNDFGGFGTYPNQKDLVELVS